MIAYVLAFLAGAVVMAVEITAGARIAPWFGSTLETWSVLIAVTLLAGSAGALVGARATRRVQSLRAVGAAFVAAGAWMAAIGVAYPTAAERLAALEPRLGLALAVALLVAPPVLTASAVFPLLVHLVSRGRRAGAVAGRLAATSTLGSLVGTLGAGLWSLPELGVSATTWGLGGAVFGVGAALLIPRPAGRAALFGLAALSPFAAAIAGGPRDTAHHAVRESAAGRIELTHLPVHVSLAVNGVVQTAYEPGAVGRGYLLRHRNHLELLPWLRPGARRALVVGCGAGLAPRVLAAYGLAVESVEVSRAVADLVRERLDFRAPIHVADGRRYLRRDERRWDLIVLDVFHGEALPAHLLSREALALVRTRLAPDGVAAVHLIGAPRAPATAAVARTLRAVFPHLFATRSGHGEELQDVYLFASATPIDAPDDPALTRFGWLGNEVFTPAADRGELLTDDRNPLALLNRAAARALRRASRRPATP